jgi:hypothetical protein
MESSTKADSIDFDKLRKQIEGCVAMCGGSSIEERFAGLLLLSKIPHAHDFLIGKSQKSLANNILAALNKANFLPRLLILPSRTCVLVFARSTIF